jgi:hypothetical protein
MNASALVVGIDKYTDVPQLSGAVTNAVEVVNWLATIGVPAARTRLHVDPTPAGLDPALILAAPTRQAIKDSLFNIANESGDRLFVFLTGHGLYIPGEGAVFLTQEWKDPNRLDANFGMPQLVDYLMSLRFRDQLLVCDACQNPSNLATQRARIPPEGVGVTGFTPNYATNGLILCQAATEGQFSYLVNGRSLLTPKLIQTLKDAATGSPPRGAEDAIVHDWTTGDRKLDLKPLFSVVRREVESAAKQLGPQTPVLEARGRARSEDQSIVHELNTGTVETIEINVINGGLDEVRLSLRPPVKEGRLPIPSVTPAFPHSVKAPLGARVQVACWTQLGWTPEPRAFDGVVPNGGLTIRFVLSQIQPPPSPASLPGDPTQFNVRIMAPDGQIRGPLDSQDYSTISELPGMSASPGFGFLDHETGPDIGFPPGGEAIAEKLAGDWRDAIHDLVSMKEPGLEAIVIPPGVSVGEGLPNLKIILASGQAEKLAGYLARSTVIRLERIGDATGRDTKRISLQELTTRSLFHLALGMWRATVDLPWGQWLETFEVKADTTDLSRSKAELTDLSLPQEIGRPPLRNLTLPADYAHSSQSLVWVGQKAEFVKDDHRSGGGFVEIYKVGARQFLVPIPWYLGGPAQPLTPTRLRARIEADALRVEPYSTLPWPEWDLLFTASRLDAVDLSRVLRRLPDLEASVPGRNEVLLLALGYAAYAQSDRTALRELLRLMKASSVNQTADYALLSETLNPGASGEADRRQVPVLRWGLTLRERFLPGSEFLGTANPSSAWTVLERLH